MADYIERETTIRKLNETYEREFPTADGAFDLFANRIMPRVIRGIPAAEVEPVRHGRWIATAYTTTSKRGRIISNVKYTCSECEWGNGRKRSNYCAVCGARMDGDNNA